jgi:hypothetical protein
VRVGALPGARAALELAGMGFCLSARRAEATPAIAKKRGGEQIMLFVLRLCRRTVR